MPEIDFGLYTIGHDGRTLPDLIALLKQHHIEFVVDVRPNPITPQPDFSQPNLIPQLQEQGLRYLFLGDSFRLKAEEPAYQYALQRLQNAYGQRRRVALLGRTAAPEQCPRGQHIGHALAQQNMAVWHIEEDGSLQPHATVANRPRPAAHTPAEILRHTFGYPEFRPLQADIIHNALNRRDTLAIMPTGSGKSLCYQIPALLFDGLTVVVSPLISLMQDQVMQLHALGVSAAYLNSSLDYATYGQTVQDIRAGRYKLLYAAPETLLRDETLNLLAQTQLDALVIDEAHCISSWGHDFRPEYRQIAAVRQRFPSAVCLAFTATATPRVQQDIKQTLHFRDENEFLASFDRPNLFLEVLPKRDAIAQVLAFVRERPSIESGIIYCATRKQVDNITAALRHAGFNALPYHGGMDSETRAANQNAFIYDKVPIMVATIAFGMGINKPDVRYVLHADLPKDVESYYQQIGRAGRDGLPAHCRLLLSLGDVFTQRKLIESNDPAEQAGQHARLDEMVRWAQAADCRRNRLLAYFGETASPTTCDQCDNCRQTEHATADLTIAAQKFLSCVKRTGGRFGASHIIKILRGSRDKKLLQWGHDKLSTYNIGQEFSNHEWQFLAQQFVQMDLLEPDLQYQTLKLTAEGEAVLKGKPVAGRLPQLEDGLPRKESAADLSPRHPELFEVLRRKRAELAAELNYPPYAIFPDRTLIEMATYLPQSPASLANVHGVGELKLKRYGEPFIKLIQWYCRNNGLAEEARPTTAVPSSPPPTSLSPRALQMAQAFTNGRTIPDLVREQGVKRQTIISHLGDYVKAGHKLPAERLQEESELTAEQQAAVMTAFDTHGGDYLRPIYDALQGQVDYDELHLWRIIWTIGA